MNLSQKIRQNNIDKIREVLPTVKNSIIGGDQIQVYSSSCGITNNAQPSNTIFKDKETDMFKLPVMNAKIYKVLAHKYFSSPITVYLDNNIALNVNSSILCDQWLKDADMALFKHPWRDCIYNEREHARERLLPQFRPLLDEQVMRYRSEGFPPNFGLVECGMIIRRNNAITTEFNERWWAEICRYTNRDQISFPYILWKMKNRIKVLVIDGNVRQHPYFKYIYKQ